MKYVDREELKEQFNQRLKTIKTYQELEELLKDMDESGWGFHLYGKRRRYVYAYGFSHLYEATKTNGEPHFYNGWESVRNRVHYLYSDSISTGQSMVKNLHRFFTID